MHKIELLTDLDKIPYVTTQVTPRVMNYYLGKILFDTLIWSSSYNTISIGNQIVINLMNG